jgi:2'-5' RNA ligase
MRLFVAVWPPDSVVRQLASIDRPDRAGLRWTTEDQWHVTLRFLGEVGSEERAGLERALASVRSDPGVGPVVVQAGPQLVRLGSSVLCLPVAGLEAVAAAVVEHTSPFGAPVESRPFRGHLTIARAARGVDPRLRDPVAFRASWKIEEITLVASTLHPHGARYEIVGRYQLG